MKFNLQANLQRWLGNLIDVHELTVVPDGPTLNIELRYQVRGTRTVRTDQFSHTV